VYISQIINVPWVQYINQAQASGVDILVMEDNAAVHFKSAAKELCALHPIPEKPHPQSWPHVNAIEIVLGTMKRHLQALKRKPNSQDRLWEVLQLGPGRPRATRANVESGSCKLWRVGDTARVLALHNLETCAGLESNL
jgi:hypothetical protein